MEGTFSHAQCTDTLNADTDERVEDGLSPGQVASAILPAAIFNQIRNLEGTDVEAIGVFFSLYEESSLFPIAGAPNDTRIGSPVVAATVAGRTFRNLPEPVIVLVRLNDITDGVSECLIHANDKYQILGL